MSQLAPNRWRVHARQDSDLLKHLCALRGFSAEVLSPDYATHLHDPFLLPDMEQACQIVREAVDASWHVTVFGDYDADGTPASAILSMMLTQLGLAHDVVLPTRATGYGLRPEQVRDIAKRSQLLITVDTGVTSVEEIRLAKELGMRVIVLDHHLPQATLPAADAVVDPHRSDSQYPFAHLCGCALAYKFVVALGTEFPQLSERFSKWLLDLVAISTVADMMPLIGENRALVHYGLLVLRQNRRPGLRALFATAGVEVEALNAGILGFVIGPRLNAAGRLGDNYPAFELLTAPDDSAAQRLAAVIEEANSQRQTLVQDVMEKAQKQLLRDNTLTDSILLLAKEGWPSGVVGLVAGKLSGQYARPALVATFEDDVAKGSARSIESYPIVDALQRHADLLGSFGGHASAAGFSLPRSKWPDFVAALKRDAAERLRADDLRRTFVVDAELVKDDLAKRSVDSLEKLQPFGLGNGRPLFLLRDAQLRDMRKIGREGRHLKSRVVACGEEIDCVAFNCDDSLHQAEVPIDCIGHLEVNRWNDRESVQFQLIDYRLSGEPVEWIANG